MFAAIGLALGACGDNLAPDRGPDLALHDEIYASATDDGVLCAANADDDAYKLGSILAGLDRARDQGRVIQLFAHDPGGTISLGKLEAILDGARVRGLRFVTYRELAAGDDAGPGVALAFDDWFIDDWSAHADLLKKYGARATFFVADYVYFSPDGKAQLHALANAGHDVEYHSTNHADAPAYVEQYGLRAYLTDEIAPGLNAMRADGYDPIAFAYPAGKRTFELDNALLQEFAALRATTLHCPHMDEP